MAPHWLLLILLCALVGIHEGAPAAIPVPVHKIRTKREPDDNDNSTEEPKLDEPLDWWKIAVIYHIYPLSFKDSDGDGYGDLQGIIDKLDYLDDLGVGAIWLSPIYKSPMEDFGYDVKDFKSIDPVFGDMEDFETLAEKTEKLGIKLILDFIPNHTSDEHYWFKQSVKRVDPYTDYYVWKDSEDNGEDGEDDDDDDDDDECPNPPNNWLSVFGGSAWEWNDVRKQFFLHQFGDEQPDLNLNNSDVKEELMDVLRFWLDKGVDGFRVDAVSHLLEDHEFKDEPRSEDDVPSTDYDYLKHVYTTNEPENYELVEDWRQLLDEYKAKDGHTRILLTESYSSIRDTMRYYKTDVDDDDDNGDEDEDDNDDESDEDEDDNDDDVDDGEPGAHFPMNFLLIGEVTNESDAHSLNATIHKWMDNLPEECWPNWVIGNHDVPRVATRLGQDMVDAMNMLVLLLPGTAITYYGEEIGMDNTEISWKETVDPAGIILGPEKFLEESRDPVRTPFQWDDSENAGFSSGTSTWLPVNDDYEDLNLKDQREDEESHYLVYKRLIRARLAPVVQKGSLFTYVISDNVFAFTRELDDDDDDDDDDDENDNNAHEKDDDDDDDDDDDKKEDNKEEDDDDDDDDDDKKKDNKDDDDDDNDDKKDNKDDDDDKKEDNKEEDDDDDDEDDDDKKEDNKNDDDDDDNDDKKDNKDDDDDDDDDKKEDNKENDDDDDDDNDDDNGDKDNDDDDNNDDNGKEKDDDDDDDNDKRKDDDDDDDDDDGSKNGHKDKEDNDDDDDDDDDDNDVEDAVLVLINLGTEVEVVNLEKFKRMPDNMTVYSTSQNSELNEGDIIISEELRLSPRSAVVLVGPQFEKSFDDPDDPTDDNENNDNENDDNGSKSSPTSKKNDDDEDDDDEEDDDDNDDDSKDVDDDNKDNDGGDDDEEDNDDKNEGKGDGKDDESGSDNDINDNNVPVNDDDDDDDNENDDENKPSDDDSDEGTDKMSTAAEISQGNIISEPQSDESSRNEPITILSMTILYSFVTCVWHIFQ